MSDAKKCDRCGIFYEASDDPDNDVKYIRAFNKHNRSSHYYDLCPECAAKFKEFMNLSDKDIFDSNGVKIKEGDILINDNHWDLLVVTDNNYPGLLICVNHDAVRRANRIGEMSLITAVNMGYHVKENKND